MRERERAKELFFLFLISCNRAIRIVDSRVDDLCVSLFIIDNSI